MHSEQENGEINERIARLQQIIDTRIVPAAAMGVRISGFTGDGITLSAPLEKNLNHHGTAFGGSLYSIAAVAGWALLEMCSEEAQLAADIVVSNASVSYLAPVTSDYSVRVYSQNPRDVNDAIAQCRKDGKAAVTLLGSIEQNGFEALRSEATYTLLQQRG